MPHLPLGVVDPHLQEELQREAQQRYAHALLLVYSYTNPTLAAHEVEAQSDTIAMRRKQIQAVKAHPLYVEYLHACPLRSQRRYGQHHEYPMTPRAECRMSHSDWERLMSSWMVALELRQSIPPECSCSGGPPTLYEAGLEPLFLAHEVHERLAPYEYSDLRIHDPSLKAHPKWEEKRSAQVRQIKRSCVYQEYAAAVPRHKRLLCYEGHPITPRASFRQSPEAWDARFEQWVQDLHVWTEDTHAAAVTLTLEECGLEREAFPELGALPTQPAMRHKPIYVTASSAAFRVARPPMVLNKVRTSGAVAPSPGVASKEGKATQISRGEYRNNVQAQGFLTTSLQPDKEEEEDNLSKESLSPHAVTTAKAPANRFGIAHPSD